MAENINIPKISVVMPVYNGEKYLKEAIDSILVQTYKDFELLLINDGSSDKTEEIILSYDDKRISYIKNEKNLGLIRTLNIGLDIARGEFIARMDQDDISMPTRFEKQLRVFENNPEIGVCGTWFTLIKDSAEIRTICHPELSEHIKIALLSYCALGHPTVMLRKKVIGELRYDVNYQAAEDYEFWTRLSRATELYNIQEALLLYRFHDSNISVLEDNLQQKNAEKIICNQLLHLGLNNNIENIKLCEILFGKSPGFRFSQSKLKNVISFSNSIEISNRKKKIYNEKIFHQTITHQLKKIFENTEGKNFGLILFVLKERPNLISERRLIDNIKMIAKIILKK